MVGQYPLNKQLSWKKPRLQPDPPLGRGNVSVEGHCCAQILLWEKSQDQSKSNTLLPSGGPFMDSCRPKCKQEPGGSFTQFIIHCSCQPASQSPWSLIWWPSFFPGCSMQQFYTNTDKSSTQPGDAMYCTL
jgi:hypothetical protein